MSPKQIKAPDEIWELMKFMATDMYTSALKVSPVAACASKTPSESFFNTVIDAGHPEAAEAVDYMMNVETKISHIYPSWKPEVEKEINSVWNDVLMGKKDISELKAVEEKVNQIIADSNK
jgi:multiple sugar transport system substrate-binding protein